MCARQALPNPRLDIRTQKQDNVEVFRISLEDKGLPSCSVRKMLTTRNNLRFYKENNAWLHITKNWACSCVPGTLVTNDEDKPTLSQSSGGNMPGNLAKHQETACHARHTY